MDAGKNPQNPGTGKLSYKVIGALLFTMSNTVAFDTFMLSPIAVKYSLPVSSPKMIPGCYRAELHGIPGPLFAARAFVP